MRMRALRAGPAVAAAISLAAAPAVLLGTGGLAPAVLASGSGPGQNLSAAASPIWQTDNTVWALAVANGVLYVGGEFTTVRPPGDPLGTGEVSQPYLAAFSASTGDLITSFSPAIADVGTCSPSIPCGVSALAVSPDRKTLYVGGTFTHVDGQYRDHLAALDISAAPTPTGALLPTWKPTAGGKVLSIAPSPDGSEVYIGGTFTVFDGQAREHAAAVSASGALQPWAPNLNSTVDAIAVAPDDSRVLVGGYFSAVNGVTQQGIASTNPASGASEPWAATIEPHTSTCTAAVKDIIVSGGTAYIASEGTGPGCFDGDFAASISSGSLVWQNDCLGATQALAIVNGWLYKGSHAHDCAYAPGGFPQVRDSSGTGWVTHHLLDQSLTDGSLGHWTPNTDNTDLGPRVFATDGTQLFVGGGFITVNGTAQQGLTRFEPAPDVTGPTRPGQPVAVSTTAGVVNLTFTGSYDNDDGTITYRIYRDSGTSPIAKITDVSWPWAIPVLHYRDAGLTPGSSHTYWVAATDGAKGSQKSATSAPVTVSSASPSLTYEQTVLAGHPSFLWQLNETSGTTAADATGHGFTGVYEPGTSQGQPGPANVSDYAAGFDGKTGLVTAASPVTGPQAFSIEGWFKTTTNTGGMLIGFGNKQTGSSTSYDRHIYMMNDGQLVFGVYNSGLYTIETPDAYNDGQWHYVAATLGPSGMALYVDGQLTGTNANHAAQSYTGYWRVGGDNLNGWNLDYWHSNSQGTTEPNDYYFTGTIADVAVYPYALSASQVAAHYASAVGP